jgi:hypothetical protein
MALHLLKLAVGIDDIDHLRRVRTIRAGKRAGHWVYTRNCPRRAAEVLDGGSIYWVIRGQIAVRQRVTGFRVDRDETGRRCCLIEVDPVLVPTILRSCRAFQGWRYLPADVAPPDQALIGAALAPGRMLAELRGLGLL